VRMIDLRELNKSIDITNFPVLSLRCAELVEV